jgi:uncharacterized protein (TIGR03437 family)
MFNRRISGAILSCLIVTAGYAQTPGRVLPQYVALPQSFEPNRGQAAGRFDFLSHGAGYALLLNSNEADLRLLPARDSSQPVAVRFKLLGARRRAPGSGRNPQPGTSNYFVGKEPGRWRTGIPQFGRVEYAGVYPGIDLAYYGNQQRLEYDFLLRPHADPHAIRLSIEGADRVRIDESGDLVLTIGSTEIRQRKPTIYQDSANGRTTVAGRYVRRGPRQVGFEVADYDSSKDLVIDPTLVFSTYFGGPGAEVGNAIALDSNGNVYIAGNTNSVGAPATSIGPLLAGGNQDAFIAKFSASGTLIYFTEVGGGDPHTFGSALAVDMAGNAYLAGSTTSSQFPTMNAIQGSYHGATDGFVLELNSAGNTLVYSTYLGGNNLDYVRAISVDALGDAYVTGTTQSANFPIANPMQSGLRGNANAFAAQLSPGGASFVYSTYLGGDGVDFNNGNTIDANGNLYVYGDTSSTNFPLLNAFQKINGGLKNVQNTGWVSKLGPTGTLVFSTYLGGSRGDSIRGAQVDATGSLLLTGNTASSSDFPLVKALQSKYGGGNYDAFLAKLDPTGSVLLYSTFLGGNAEEEGLGLVIDSLGNSYLTGYTFSTNFPVANPIQAANAGASDAFLTEISADGSTVLFSTYLGGSGQDIANGLALNSSSTAFLVGTTASVNFPTLAASQPANGGNTDAFLASIAVCGFTVTPSNTFFGAAGGSGTVSIATSNVCGWTASSNSPWITLGTVTSGAAAGAVTFAVARNASAATLTGSISVAGQIISITEASASIGLSSISPAAGIVGATVPVMLTGTNFLSGATVSVSSPGVTVSNVALVSSTQITATLNISATATPGPVNVTVNVLGVTSAAVSFNVNLPVPVLTSLTPAIASSGASVPITLSGSGFNAPATIAVNVAGIQAANVQVVSSSQITAVLNVAAAVPPGPAAITVTTPGGTSGAATLAIDPPQIGTGGIVNAGSYAPAGLSNGGIARGSIFLIYGANLGPVALVGGSYPLQPMLAGTSVQVTAAGTSLPCVMAFTSSTVLAVIMPSTAVAGLGTITVTYNGQTSAPAPIRVVTSSFGIFTLNEIGTGPGAVTDTSYRPITLTHAAHPGDTLVLWGTGLGPINGPDNVVPPVGNLNTPMTLYVGSQPVAAIYHGRGGSAGLDQINFVVPVGITGCYVPITVETSVPSNFATIAIAASGDVCSDADGFSTAQLQNVESGNHMRLGLLSLTRAQSTDGTQVQDTGSAQFLDYTPDQLTRSLSPLHTPSEGSCVVYAFSGSSATITDPIQPQPLDAGQTISISGPNGNAALNAAPSAGSFATVLGSSDSGQMYLNPGSYTFNGSGGAAVGSFQGQVQMPGPVAWTNQNTFTTVNRSQSATLQWTGGASGGHVYITGASFATSSGPGAMFSCTASASAGQFTLPSIVLLALPPSAASTPGYISIANASPAQPFTPARIDAGIATASAAIVQLVMFQ